MYSCKQMHGHQAEGWGLRLGINLNFTSSTSVKLMQLGEALKHFGESLERNENLILNWTFHDGHFALTSYNCYCKFNE